jgi:hypothetical protein
MHTKGDGCTKPARKPSATAIVVDTLAERNRNGRRLATRCAGLL